MTTELPRSPKAKDAESLVDRLATEMAERWQRGERPLVEDLLARHPELRNSAELASGLVYEEVCLRQRYGLDAAPADIIRRFPQWQEQLEVLLRCHQLVQSGLAGPAFPAAGETLGEFLLLSELGRGAWSCVYLASQPALADRQVVLKATPPDGREHVSLARLQHTHIVPLYSVHDDSSRGLRLLVMPYFGGTTLARVLEGLADRPVARRSGRDLLAVLDATPLEAAGPVPARGPARDFLTRASYVQAVCWVGACLADALQYAHERGLVHLDVKPSNVLLAADGQPMLLDFHLARPPLPAAGAAVEGMGGTLSYMPPEQRMALEAASRGAPAPAAVDGRADVYALGLLLYEALGGAFPLPPGPAPRLEACNGQVSVGLADILHRCLGPRPADRYATAAALAADLRRHLSNLPLQGVPNRSWRERWGKWRARRPRAFRQLGLLAALLFAAATVTGLLLFSLRGRHAEARAHLARGVELRNAGQYGDAVSALRRGLDVAQGLPFADELKGRLSTELRQAQRQQAATLLEQGRQLAQAGREAEAVTTLRRAMLQLDDVPDQQALRGLVQHELQRAERAEAAGELHALMNRVRFHYGEPRPAPGRGWEPVESRLASFWERRTWLLDRTEPDPDAALRRQIREDLLDLAVLRADALARGPGARTTAAQAALRLVTEAEALLGPSRALCRERRRHAAALGLTDEARAAQQRGAELTPRTAWEYYALGRALLGEGHLDEAAELLERAVALQPQGLWPNFYAGVCAYRRGRFLEAATAFSACVALEPSSARCRCNRGLALAKLGEPGPAEKDYDEALRLEPTLAAAALNRALLHLHAKRLQAAADDLQRARANGADPALVHYTLALVHQAAGERDAALASLRLALHYNPDHAEARRLLQRLRAKP